MCVCVCVRFRCDEWCSVWNKKTMCVASEIFFFYNSIDHQNKWLFYQSVLGILQLYIIIYLDLIWYTSAWTLYQHRGGMVGKWVAQSPDDKKALDSIPRWSRSRSFMCGLHVWYFNLKFKIFPPSFLCYLSLCVCALVCACVGCPGPCLGSCSWRRHSYWEFPLCWGLHHAQMFRAQECMWRCRSCAESQKDSPA